MISLFFSYSHVDEQLRDQLEIQLAMLKRQGAITTWHDRRIGAGQHIDSVIDVRLEEADIILLLVSPDFLASDYCYNREMIRALERHDAGEAIVIPVILRTCEWHHAPFGKLMATPTDGRAVTQWPDRDEAFLLVAKAIREAVGRIAAKGATAAPVAVAPTATASTTVQSLGPRSSNLRLAKEFTDRDKDAFKLETFEYIARYFENSLQELQVRNPHIECSFRRVDANRFTSVIYKNGKSTACCTIYVNGDSFLNGIAYSSSETGATGSFNECLTIHADDQMLYLQNMGMSYMSNRNQTKLSQEGASELLWTMLIAPLQQL